MKNEEDWQREIKEFINILIPSLRERCPQYRYEMIIRLGIPAIDIMLKTGTLECIGEILISDDQITLCRRMSTINPEYRGTDYFEDLDLNDLSSLETLYGSINNLMSKGK